MHRKRVLSARDKTLQKEVVCGFGRLPCQLVARLPHVGLHNRFTVYYGVRMLFSPGSRTNNQYAMYVEDSSILIDSTSSTVPGLS